MEEKKQKGKCGSALIVVVSVMAFIMSIAATMAYTSSLFQDFSLQRIGIERRYRAMESLLYYGVAHCYEHSRNYEKNENSNDTLSFHSWPISQGGYSATLHFVHEEGGYTIHAELKKEDQIVSQGDTQLFLQEEIWRLGQWSIT